MKTKHEALVKVEYPDAYCEYIEADEDVEGEYVVWDHPSKARCLGTAASASGAWAHAFELIEKPAK